MDSSRAPLIGQPRYRLRGAPIIHDTIDNETIAINQLSGAYYSLDGAAALAWQQLADGASAAQLADALAARYDADRATLGRAVDGLLEQLLAEELIVVDTDGRAAVAGPAAEAAADEAAAGADAAPVAGTARLPFAGLELHRYDDLEVLLLADPIHEVDESGWPKPLTPPR